MACSAAADYTGELTSLLGVQMGCISSCIPRHRWLLLLQTVLMPALDVAIEESHDGLVFARWIGDLEATMPGWQRPDLYDPLPEHVRSFLGGFSGMLYPVFLGLLWRLSVDAVRCVLPEWDGILLCERARIGYTRIRWQYGVDYEQRDWRQRDLGFVLAESLDSGPGAPVQATAARVSGAALASIDSWQELIALVPIGDQSNTLCLFAAEDTSGADRLAHILSGDEPPSIRDLMNSPCGLIAVLTQDDEYGDLNSLLLVGRTSLEKRLKTEVAELNARIARYLVDTSASTTPGEWSRAVARLAGFTEDHDGSDASK